MRARRPPVAVQVLLLCPAVQESRGGALSVQIHQAAHDFPRFLERDQLVIQEHPAPTRLVDLPPDENLFTFRNGKDRFD